ncbi:MAG: NAD-dependent deacylase [Bacteroidaceae bacterium]|nr:NAD-dependent deacylase [Bacteroidaceae bacterium]MBR6904960.1 NAD-dependent deacylase [Bacteroidales bacterium]
MKRLVFLTGAGISAESGISTFRDSGGLWEQYPVMQVASIEGYEKDPALVIKFYNERRRQLLKVEPNEAHRLVAQLEQQYDVTVVTQNVDDLHERAGSSHIIHLHGELMKATSTYAPNDPAQIVTLTPDHLDIQMGDRAQDGSQLRPFIVWFGEAVPMIEKAAYAVQQADVLVVIGTSLNVYPAAGLLHYAKHECPIYLIDPHPANVPLSLGVEIIEKGASEGMKELCKLLG